MQLSNGLERRFFSSGTVLMKEGDIGDCALTLQIGTARVTAQGQIVGELGPGNLFGEMAILSEKGLRTATVTATTTCVVLELSRTKLLAALEKFPKQRQRFEELARSRGEVLAFFGKNSSHDDNASTIERAKTGRHHKESPIDLLRAPSDMRGEKSPKGKKGLNRCRTMEEEAQELKQARQKLIEYVDKRKYKTALAPVKREIALIRAGSITQQVQPRQGYVNHFIGRVLGYEPEELYEIGESIPAPLEKPLPLTDRSASPRSRGLPMLPALNGPMLTDGRKDGQKEKDDAASPSKAIVLEDPCQPSVFAGHKNLVLPALPATPRATDRAEVIYLSPRLQRENMTALQFRKSLHIYRQIAE